MRVISGTARGNKLQTLEGLSTRPTADRIKESLFNILSPDLYDSVFLDLFAGSGAIGIEALSRGARQAVFAENNKDAAKIIRANLAHTKMSDRAKVIEQEVPAAMRAISDTKFDIIFMDPPYGKGLIDLSLSEILKNELLFEHGKVICEAVAKEKINFSGWTLDRIKEYRTSQILFLSLEARA